MRLIFQRFGFKEVVTLFCLGGATFIFLVVALIVDTLSIHDRSNFKIYTYELFAVAALLIYQPHFVASYQLNYRRGRAYIRRHAVTLVGLPFALLSIVVLASLGTLPVPTYKIGQFLLVLVILGAIWHFSLQATGAIFRIAKFDLSSRLRKTLCALFMITALNGVLSFVQHNAETYSLFDLQITLAGVPTSITNVSFLALLIAHGVALALVLSRGIGLKALVPWLAFVAWYMSDTFVLKFFYIVPVMHALQFLPFYFKKTAHESKWIYAAVVVGSLAIVFAVPNFLSASVALRNSYVFEHILIALNLHHFAMERITWRK